MILNHCFALGPKQCSGNFSGILVDFLFCELVTVKGKKRNTRGQKNKVQGTTIAYTKQKAMVKNALKNFLLAAITDLEGLICKTTIKSAIRKLSKSY